MPNVNEIEVLTALRRVIDPELRRSIVDLGMVRDLVIENDSVAFTLALTIPGCPLRDQLVEEAYTAVKALPGVRDVAVQLNMMSESERNAAFGVDGPPPLALEYNDVQHIIAIMSGKGGVGKSTVTALLASTLTRAGYQVGVLDADVTGPSIPRLFGAHGPLNVGSQVLGIVENMAGFVAQDTGKHYEIFGPSHAEEVAAAAGAPVIARLPLDSEAAMLCDAGEVESVTQPEVDALVAHLTAVVMV